MLPDLTVPMSLIVFEADKETVGSPVRKDLFGFLFTDAGIMPVFRSRNEVSVPALGQTN